MRILIIQIFEYDEYINLREPGNFVAVEVLYFIVPVFNQIFYIDTAYVVGSSTVGNVLANIEALYRKDIELEIEID